MSLQNYSSDPLNFMLGLVVPSAHGPARFRDVAADFQVAWLTALAPSLLALARGDIPPTPRFFIEGTKGCGKDFLIALGLIWLLSFSRQPLVCQAGANDQEQAREILKELKDILRLNPRVARRIQVQNLRIACKATESECSIIPADVAGSHGSRPNLVVVNELSHLTKEEFAQNLADNAAKMPRGLMILASNAGEIDSWQWKWRQLAIESSNWQFLQWAKPAPWITASQLHEAERRNPLKRYRRLFWGEPSMPGDGDGIDEQELRDAYRLNGPLQRYVPGMRSAAGLDLGLKKDHASLVVLATLPGSGEISLAWVESWKPPVDLARVERAVLAAHHRYRFERLFYDPWQCEYLGGNLRCNHVYAEAVYPTGRTLTESATALLQVFGERRIALYREESLLRDLSRVIVVEKNYGFRAEFPASDSHGHSDRLAAMLLCLPYAAEISHQQSKTFAAPKCAERQQPDFARWGILFERAGVQPNGFTKYSYQYR